MADRYLEADTPELRSRWEGFAFTAPWEAKAKAAIARYPEGRQRSAVMALLDFAQRHEIPPPSWWAESTTVSNDEGVTRKGIHSIAASPAPSPAHLARPRGRKPKKFDRAKEAIHEDMRLGRLTVVTLGNMLEKELEARYGVSRDTARKARDAVLSELSPMKQSPSAAVSK